MGQVSHPIPVVNRGEPLKAIPRRHPYRWVATGAVVVLLAMLTNALLTNPSWQWEIVGSYLFEPRILAGLTRTLVLTVIAMTIGVALGVITAVARQSAAPIVRSSAWAYTWFFRCTPVFVQILFWYNVAALFPRLSFGVPFGPEFVSGSANQFVTPFVAAILALGLNEGAYMSEIVRGGILSVDRGQVEAAYALGMGKMQTMRRVVLPRALRVIIPPTGNQFIGMLKITSLVSVIAVTELLYSAQLIYSQNFQTIPLLLVASLWYAVITTLLSIGQFFLERYFSKDIAAAKGTSSARWRPGLLMRTGT